MKNKLISALLTAVMMLTMLAAMCPGALAAPIELTVGTKYNTTVVKTIKSETDIGLISSDAANPGVVTTDSSTKNGITVTATLSENKKSVEVVYSGTPVSEGSAEFSVKYATGGEEKTFKVTFSIVSQKTEESKEQKPSEDKSTEQKPSEEKPSEEKPTEQKPSEDKPSEEKPTEDKTTEEKPSGEKTDEEKEPDTDDPKEELPPEIESPEITKQEPKSTKLKFEQTDPEITFSVTATGSGTVSHIWRVDGVDVGVGKNLTLVPAEMTADVHTVECVVSNTVDDTSKHTTVTWEVTIEKSKAPVIKSTATTAEIDGTGSAEFEVTAEGEELKYQWYLVSGENKERVVDGTYGIMEYKGAETNKLTVKCTMAPQKASTKFVCDIVNPDGLLATTEEYVLNIKEDPDASKVQEIEVISMPARTEYMVGETLDEEGMKIKVVTGKGEEELTSGFVCEPIYLEEEGTQTITVSYGGKTTTFTVIVNKAPHEHEWTNWKLDNSVPVRVYRECVGGDDCAAKEVLSKESFIVQYPTLAAELGLKMNDEPEADNGDSNTDTGSSEGQDTDSGAAGTGEDAGADGSEAEKPDDSNKPEKDKKNGNTVLWIIIIIAVILLAAVIVYYFMVYKKPYKKPDSNDKMNK